MKRLFIFSLILIAFLMSALIYSNMAVTGYASYPAKPSESEISSMLVSVKSFSYLGEGAVACILVQMDSNTIYHYEISKKEGRPSVADFYCGDPGQDNVIIKINSYDDWTALRENPKLFMVEKRNTGYYIFPSNYVMQGGDVKCSADFQQKYCGALYAYFTSSQLSALGAPCCASFTPTGFAFFFGTPAGEGLAFLVALLAVVGLLMWVGRKKKK